MSLFKFGKLAPRHDTRTLRFKDYFSQLPPTPTAIDWTPKVPNWQMLANDTVGDCTCAGAGHLEMLWTSQASNELIVIDAEVLAAYTAITGYTPTDPNTDTGANLLDVLNYWRQTGIAGRKIQAYMQIDFKNVAHVKAAIALFGGVYAGIQCPDNMQDAFNEQQPWTDTSDKNIEGGHCIPLVAYDPNYITCVTWGATQKMSYNWAATYLDEAYAVLSPDWINALGKAPSGFDLTQLMVDLKLVS